MGAWIPAAVACRTVGAAVLANIHMGVMGQAVGTANHARTWLGIRCSLTTIVALAMLMASVPFTSVTLGAVVLASSCMAVGGRTLELVKSAQGLRPVSTTTAPVGFGTRAWRHLVSHARWVTFADAMEAARDSARRVREEALATTTLDTVGSAMSAPPSRALVVRLAGSGAGVKGS
mmetsp:Transcript_48627/g.115558  ORF Transcript_48627/g.115558 Transcript_48627/m.115558 type:complete len:176 (+) Transcript_48627:1-528(+)